MPEFAPRLPCPVCLGTTMDRLTLGTGTPLEVDHCRRCGGMWLEHGEVQQLRDFSAREVRERIRWSPGRVPMHCHDCHAPLARDAESCASCGWSNRLECPGCARPMRVETHANLRLDVCRGCRGVWFDRHELAAIWSASFDSALQRRGQTRAPVLAATETAADAVLLDTLFYAPDLFYFGGRAVAEAGGAALNGLSHVPELAAAVPDAASTAFEAVGEAATGVFEVVVDVIGGIFG